ncbi:endolytic transglycosylase MltG [Ornithinibacillus halophilus]|uniref:Endolytic murein transglycosylase n=1 Tax=Ornithinibacillus halophilus TaxID=930117 RepID=A0A1M5DJG6_9BACI|nr:endolytic transglycosylase MltG [Ornithinibacillus halophilus]SHF66892.1 UPF0755 protein [Ornithinibacillus halophilus]
MSKDDYKKNLLSRNDEVRTVRKIVSVIILILIILIVTGGVTGYNYIKSALEPVDPTNDEGVGIEIPLGSSTSSIAEVLENNEIIKDARIFKYYIKFRNESGFQAGEYTFTKSMTIDEIIESLKNGRIIKEPVFRITIPEGLTIAEMAEIYAEKLPFTKDEFLEKVNDPEYVKLLIDNYQSILTDVVLDPEIETPLEGYLFAATYDFYVEDPSIETVVEKMLDKTRAVIAEYYDAILNSEFNVHETITLASIIEKEAVTKDQRRQISGIFYNRLEVGMPLQTDPTVLYALGDHKEKVLKVDTQIESPYNTYFVNALPIGPISNFSQNALDAALYPAETDYLYFLHDSTGDIYYSETLEQHNEYKRQYIN